MRVRISYSVELEEVPGEYSRILEEAAKKLSKALSLVHNIQNGSTPQEQVLKDIEAVRILLGETDFKMSDVGMILSGYYDACKQLEESKIEVSTEETEEVEDVAK